MIPQVIEQPIAKDIEVQYRDSMAGLQEPWYQAAPDISGPAGYEHPATVLFICYDDVTLKYYKDAFAMIVGSM